MSPKVIVTMSAEEQLAEHSRRIKLLEEIFVPMAKTAMEIIMGVNGQPGMAENVRNIQTSVNRAIRKLDQLDELQEQVEVLKADRQSKILGMQISSSTKIAIINGIFLIMAGVIGYFLKR